VPTTSTYQIHRLHLLLCRRRGLGVPRRRVVVLPSFGGALGLGHGERRPTRRWWLNFHRRVLPAWPCGVGRPRHTWVRIFVWWGVLARKSVAIVIPTSYVIESDVKSYVVRPYGTPSQYPGTTTTFELSLVASREDHDSHQKEETPDCCPPRSSRYRRNEVPCTFHTCDCFNTLVRGCVLLGPRWDSAPHLVADA
jgi:hypothetical protein